MATSAEALVRIETNSTAFENVEMTNSGDNLTYNVDDVDVYSGDPAVLVKPDGIKAGTNLLSPHATVDKVQWPAFTVDISGVEVAVAAGNLAITRPATDVSKVCTLTVDSSAVVAEVEGTDGTTTAFVETYNVAGGPPYVPLNKVMIGQVRVTALASAVITTSEIKQNPGQHAEYTHIPGVKEVSHVGKGDMFASISAEQNAYVNFTSELPLIHTAGVTKSIYIDYATVSMTEIAKAYDYTPCENSHGINSTTFYRGSDASKTTSLGQGGFTVRTTNNITDFIIRRKDKETVVEFYPDENKAAFQRTMATLGMTRTFPADDQNQVAVTMTSLIETADFTG